MVNRQQPIANSCPRKRVSSIENLCPRSLSSTQIGERVSQIRSPSCYSVRPWLVKKSTSNLTTFMQNKPNFLGVLMNANAFSQGDYENEARLQARRKQTQFKPNQTQFQMPHRIRSLSSSENAYNPPPKKWLKMQKTWHPKCPNVRFPYNFTVLLGSLLWLRLSQE